MRRLKLSLCIIATAFTSGAFAGSWIDNNVSRQGQKLRSTPIKLTKDPHKDIVLRAASKYLPLAEAAYAEKKARVDFRNPQIGDIIKTENGNWKLIRSSDAYSLPKDSSSNMIQNADLVVGSDNVFANNPELVKAAKKSSFNAYVFQNEKTGERVLSFRGSSFDSTKDTVVDWRTNISAITLGVGNSNDKLTTIAQMIGLNPNSDSYLLAKAAAISENAKGGNLVITGHSKGGAEAAFAAAGTGINAITYNAPGLIGVADKGTFSNIAHIRINNEAVSTFGTKLGQVYELSIPPGFSVTGALDHSTEALYKAIEITRSGDNYLSSRLSDIGFSEYEIEKAKPIEQGKESNNNRTTHTANVITSQVSSLGSISFQPVYAVQPKAVNQPRILSSGGNTYTEGGWSVTYGLNSGLRQGVSGSELGLSTNNNGYTVISNEGAPFIYAQQTFKAGAGNNGTFNFESLAAFITKEQQRCAPCSTFGLDRAYITFISSTGQQVTKNLQEIYGVDKLGRVIFPNKVANGTLTTPLKQVVQSMQMAPGSTMKVIVNVNNSVNNDTLYPSSFAITNVRAK